MKATISIGSVLILASALAFAGAPVKKPDTSYSHLSTNSPFTSKPPPPIQEAGPAPLDDWALGGVSEVEGGHMVTIFHKKNAGETQIIRPSGTLVKVKDEMKWLNPGAPGSYKVERVEYGKESWKDTVVYLTSGNGGSDKVAFDDKLLAPAASAAPAQGRPPGQPGQPVIPGQPPVQLQQPGVIAPGQPGGRAPRQRVVVPPAPTPGR
jgi:hypothetical protein